MEGEIADLAEEAASYRAQADVLERELMGDAGKVIGEFLLRPSLQLAEDAEDLAIARDRLAEIDSHPERVIRGADLEERLRRWES